MKALERHFHVVLHVYSMPYMFNLCGGPWSVSIKWKYVLNSSFGAGFCCLFFFSFLQSGIIASERIAKKDFKGRLNRKSP